MSDNKKFFGINDINWGHKWGFKDSGFVINNDKSVTFAGNRYPICGKRLTRFVPFVEEMLGVEFKIEPKVKEQTTKHIEPPKVNEGFLKELNSTFNEDRFTMEDNERILHSRGQHSTDEVYKVLYGKLEHFTALDF